jgi:CelD/BcsL family acetyltransferase involved in cellulose biosynthesis
MDVHTAKKAQEPSDPQNLPLSGLRSADGTWKTEAVCSFDALVPHLAAWDQLAWEAPQKLPILLPGWVDAFLRHRLTPNERWLCCFAYLGDRLVGVLPVIVTPHRLLGSAWPTLRTPSDAHTPSGDVLLAPDQARAAFEALLTELRRQMPHHLGLDLKAVRQNSPVWEAIKDGLGGYAVRFGLRSRFSFLDVRGSADAYWSSLGKMRQNLRRCGKKLDSRGHVSVEIRTGSSANEDFYPDYLALEASGWKGRNGTAMIGDSNVVAFYTTLIRNFAAKGRWEWHVLRVGERVVAAGMGVRCGLSLILPKYAFDEDFADCTPGHLLTAEVFKDAFSRIEIGEINHMSLSGPDKYWRMSQDEYVDVHLVHWSVVPMLFQLPRIAMRSVYQNYVQPRIPAVVKEAHRKFKRRGDRRPRRAAESTSAAK